MPRQTPRDRPKDKRSLSFTLAGMSLLLAPAVEASPREHRVESTREPVDEASPQRQSLSRERRSLDPVRARIVEAARAYLEERRAPGRQDCSGFVTVVLVQAGLFESGGTPAIHARARAEGRLKKQDPRPGDIVFFDRTFDRNRNGRVDDPLTHVAIVVDVGADGTIEMVHRSSRGARPTRLRMNLERPRQRRHEGAVINDVLSARGYGPRRLTGELFRGFASPPAPK